jgi:hypothetical protein
MMAMHLARRKLQRFLDGMREHHAMNTGDVSIYWDASAAPADVNVEADYAQTDRQSATIRGALIHHVSAKAAASNYTTFEAGDVLVTFDAATLDFTGKRNISFQLPDGNIYVQADTGKDPVELWSVFVGGSALTKTLHLRRTP